jgi:hypothetical protein
MEVGDGSLKTTALRGVKDNPPYLHDQRLLHTGGRRSERPMPVLGWPPSNIADAAVDNHVGTGHE